MPKKAMAQDANARESVTAPRKAPLWREPELWLAAALVLACYFLRLDALTIRGEESRRAQVAVEMLQRGDWIVPRQQGQVYVSRPPLGSWPIAAVGYLRGQVDVIAIRLPTVTAILLTALLIYWYARKFLSPVGALASSLAFATMGQVMELGRLAETEGTLTLLIACSLLVWHAGYAGGSPPWRYWAAGYVFAALAGLAKGPQGPVYFVAASWAHLALRRDWRTLVGRGHIVGMAAGAAVLLAWQIPYYLATDWTATRAIWLNNAAKRFTDNRPLVLLKHLASYPLELFACMLPWSLLLPLYFDRRLRASLSGARKHAVFLAVAVGVTFPSVWFASGARGRYFMPLYPCFAVLAGIAIERATQAAAGGALGRRFRAFVVGMAVAACVLPLAVAAISWLPLAAGKELAQPGTFAAAYLAISLSIAAVLWRLREASGPAAVRWTLVSMAGFLALSFAGLVVNVHAGIANDTAANVAAARQALPPGAALVSLGRIDHLFAFHFGRAIPAVEWPRDGGSLPGEGSYFCFDEQPAQPPALPFAYERLQVVSLDRNVRSSPERTVVIARRTSELARRPEGEREAPSSPPPGSDD